MDGEKPTATLVRTFEGKDCGVPLLTGHFWLQTVPTAHSVIALDITDPADPREISSLNLGEEEKPHWIAIDGTGRRVVVNSSGGGRGNRLYIANFDPATGGLSLDQGFRDAGASRAGVSLRQRTWPHGFTGTVYPHGTVFSR